MATILLGSRALAHWDKCSVKSTTDYDVISDQPIVGTEWHNPAILNNSALSEYATTDVIRLPNGELANVLSLTGLAIVKRSHLWRDLAFDKHITHWHKHGLQEQSTLFTKRDIAVLAERTELTKASYPQRNPNLMQLKDDFFNDAVKKFYDHDYLHELVAYYDAPLYTRLLRDPQMAWCDKAKWDQLSHTDQIKCVLEEVYVIAIERFMLPSNWECQKSRAFFKSLNKVCTTLCSGWFRDKAIDYYPDCVAGYDPEKFINLKRKLSHD